MLMILTPSEPRATNTTTTPPFARMSYRDQPVAFALHDYGSFEKRFIQIGEVEAIVLGDVGKALRFVPNDLHEYIVFTN